MSLKLLLPSRSELLTSCKEQKKKKKQLFWEQHCNNHCPTGYLYGTTNADNRKKSKARLKTYCTKLANFFITYSTIHGTVNTLNQLAYKTQQQ
jgi:hypothetical protein